MLQNFDEMSEREQSHERMAALRGELAKNGVDYFVFFRTDLHQNEYIAPNAERLAWLTAFTGSAGAAIIGAEKAAIFIDSRYTIQAAEQSDQDLFENLSLSQAAMAEFLKTNAQNGDVIAIDGWTSTIRQKDQFQKLADEAGCVLKVLGEHPVDAVWADRPRDPVEPIAIHPIEFAGELASDKIAKIQASIRAQNASSLIITDPTSICWLLNIRGNDIAKTPSTLCCAIMGTDSLQLFINSQKLNIETKAYLTQLADLYEMDEFTNVLEALSSSDGDILLDKSKTAHQIFAILDDAKGQYFADPIVPLRAIKNKAEIDGSKAAHIRDGVALCEFLTWLDTQPIGSIDEITAAKKLEECRFETASRLGSKLLDLSFDTISASGPNAALPHYRVNTQSNRTLQEGELYLVDSGAQYQDGTTDITRTIAIGSPSDEQRDRFTRVLKGHIGIATARFPKGTKGAALDPFARHALWEAGCDFGHGTGHGVGSYLSVHEGPQSISLRSQVAIETGMITSNEPGYYKEGAYGIRIENLELACGPEAIDGGDIEMMYFESLTLCPIDLRLVDIELLTDMELNWLNDYHMRVFSELSELVSKPTLEWLENAAAILYR